MDDDRVFKALADPTRRLLLDRLFARDGRTLTELAAEVEMTRFGVMSICGCSKTPGSSSPAGRGGRSCTS
jgi:hypothetical protein